MRSLRRKAQTYALALPGVREAPATRFVLFAQGRSGSTLLGELLGSHPDVVWADEILGTKVLSPRLWVEGYSRTTTAPVFGFKVKIYQLTEDQRIRDPRAWIHRVHSDGWRILHLWRRNVVRQVLSNMIREQRRSSHDRVGTAEGAPRISVDVDTLLYYCRWRHEHHAAERRLLDGLPIEVFNYEDDLLDGSKWQQTADRAFRHLGIAPAPVSTDLLRITTAPLTDLVENFAEVVAALASTPYAELLRQD